MNTQILQKILYEVLFLLYGGMLLYADYLQDSGIFSVELNLSKFRATFDSFEMFKHMLLFDATNRSFDNWPDLVPPFPQIDLSYIGPVFLENGSVYLSCKSGFSEIKCRPKGIIPSTKIYMPSSLFSEATYQQMEFHYELKDYLKCFQMQGENVNYPFTSVKSDTWIKRNKNSLTLTSNYFYLFSLNSSLTVNENEAYLNRIGNNVISLARLMLLNKVNYGVLFICSMILYIIHLSGHLISIMRPQIKIDEYSHATQYEDDDSIIEYIPMLFNDVEQPNNDEKSDSPYRWLHDIDTIAGSFELGYTILTGCFLLNYLLYYICCLTIRNVIEAILDNIKLTSQLKGISTQGDRRGLFKDVSGRTESFTGFLWFCKIILNFFIYATVHWLWGYLLLVYTKGL